MIAVVWTVRGRPLSGCRSVVPVVSINIFSASHFLFLLGNILSKHFTPYFLFSRKDLIRYSSRLKPITETATCIYWRHSYVINSKEYLTNRWNIFNYLQLVFFQLFTLKFLCKLVYFSKSYARKQKGVFFSEHSVMVYIVPWTTPSPYHKRHLDRFSRFGRIHDHDQHTHAANRPHYPYH